MKTRTKCLLLPFFLLLSGMAHSMSIGTPQNIQINDNTLSWDAVADAGGYNIYYFAGGPSKFGVETEYLTTVKNATSYSDLQPGIYSVVAFNEAATIFGNKSAAIWLRDDGTVDDFTDSRAGTTVTLMGSNDDRYRVETRCVDEGSSICVASCNTDGLEGIVTGGYCSASDAHINASGGTDAYQCYSPTGASLITAGAYCLR